MLNRPSLSESDTPPSREKWLTIAESVKSRFFKFANARPVSEQLIEDVFQDVVADLVLRVDIDETFSEGAARNFVLMRLRGALQDRCRELDSFPRRTRNNIDYILSKVRPGKALEEVLVSEGVSLDTWRSWNTPKPRDYELGARSDILSSAPTEDGNRTGPNSLLDAFAVTPAFQEDETEEESDAFLAENIKKSVHAFFETLDLRGKLIVYCYYLANKNALEVGLFFGVTESRIVQKLADYMDGKQEMLTVLSTLKKIKWEDSAVYDALVDLREEVLALIQADLEPEGISALNEFLAEERVKRGQDLLEVLKSVSSSLRKTTL